MAKRARKKIVKVKRRKGKPYISRADIALAKIVENRGNVANAMREAGFSRAYARNPQQFKATKRYKNYVAAFRDNIDMAEVLATHHDLMTAEDIKQVRFFYKIPDDKVIDIFSARGFQVIDIERFMTQAAVFVWAPDRDARRYGLDIALKILGEYAPEKMEFTDPLDELSDEELMERKRAAIAKYKKTLDERRRVLQAELDKKNAAKSNTGETAAE